mmetsp:Transcript_32681/g.31904  ORF Transcript_32681/g.31904 Transcript_32681/m.31904 type:complete len:137 (-) Transcript_32681:951-1361(-)
MKAKMSSMGEQFECGICYEVMHQAVSLMPCLHSFCGACFTDWMQKMKDCPNCRLGVKEVKKNAMLNSLIEQYLSLNPGMKKNEETIKEQDARNIFTMDLYNMEKPPKMAAPKPVVQVQVAAPVVARANSNRSSQSS